MTIRWLHGDRELREGVESRLRRGVELAEGSERRRILSIDGPHEQAWIVKQFRPPTRRRAARWMSRQLGRSAAEREWRALRELRRAGLPVPAPLGLALRSDGEWWLVLERVEGRSLESLLAASPEDSSSLLPAVGRLLAQLHEAGWIHGDLHVGNLMVTSKGPVLIDFQAARPSRSKQARVRDVASLDFSLAHAGLAAEPREQMSRAALGDAKVSEVERASRAHASSYYRSRTRRCLQPGRLYERVGRDGWHGMRVIQLSDDDLFAALEAHRHAVARGGPAVLKCDHRGRASAVLAGELPVVVKEVTKGGAWKRLADRFRGSPGRRAWVAGHGLKARGIGAALPLAFVERRGLAGPARSLVLLEDLRPARPAGAFLSRAPGSDRDDALEALGALAIRLHERNVEHGDLQAHHVFCQRQTEGLRTTLIDLEGVRFRRRLSDRARIAALAQLNASLHDDLVSPAERRRIFHRYATALPFGESEARALARVVALSLAREHLFTGRDCGERARISAVAR